MVMGQEIWQNFIQESVFFGVLVSFGAYELCALIHRKWNYAFLNPLLWSVVLVIVFLLATGIDYEVYEEGAQYISYFLTPATVALAVPLYEQLEILKKNWKAVLAGILSGALTSALCVLILSILFGLNHEMYVTLLPKSITTAIGMGLSEELGGIVSITVPIIVVTGIFGNMIAESVCKLFRITEPVAQGVAIGTSSHVAGTAKAMEIGRVQGAMSSLSIAVSGLITVVIASLFSMLY